MNWRVMAEISGVLMVAAAAWMFHPALALGVLGLGVIFEASYADWGNGDGDSSS